MNYCQHTIEDAFKKEPENIYWLLLYIIYLLENIECCKNIDGGDF